MIDNSRDIVDFILNNGTIIENQKSAYPSYLRRIASWQNEFVKYAFQDDETKRTLAIVFFNDADMQTVADSALRISQQYSGCICCFHLNNMEEASSFSAMIESTQLDNLSLGIIVYDNSSNVAVIKPLNVVMSEHLRLREEHKAYWCWWRDSSNFEIAQLLELSEKYDRYEGDIYTKYVYPEFFDMMISGRTLKWDGTPRKKKYSESSFKSEKQNYKIPMFQLGLWDAESGHLTEKGKRLLDIAERHGSNSDKFFNCLARLILIDGNHLDLIKDLDLFQKSCPELIPEKSEEFFIMFDSYMITKNSMVVRKPSAVKTGAKKSYIRDEPKLWNKLGIVNQSAVNRYYIPFKGIDFNWNRIKDILVNGCL